METRLSSPRASVLALITFLIAASLLAGLPSFGQGVPNAISYQGRLTDSSGQIVPNGAYSMRFKLFDAQNAGNLLWDSGTTSVSVSGGVFAVELQPIDSATLATGNVWLETQPAGSPALPRVKLTAAPFALRSGDFALPFAGSLSSNGAGLSVTNTGTGPAISASGIYAAELLGKAYVSGNLGVGTAGPTEKLHVLGNALLTPAGGFSLGTEPRLSLGDGNNYIKAVWGEGVRIGVFQGVDALAVNNGGNVGIGTTSPEVRLDVAGVIRSISGGFQFPDGTVQTTAATGGSGWGLTGNSGTTAGTNFLGTTDPQPLEIRVAGSRVLRLEPAADAGFPTESTSPNVIGGSQANSVTANVIGATIAGGGRTDYHWVSHETTYRPNEVTDCYGTIGGGVANQAGDGVGDTNDKPYATVGGGYGNTASGAYSTVPGGLSNRAIGANSFAAGYRARADHAGAFVWADSAVADFVSTANNQFLIRASGGVGIGTTDTTHALSVQSADDRTLRLMGSGGSGAGGKLNFGDGDHVYVQEDTDDNLTISGGRIAVMGTNLGVGTLYPAEKLHVSSGNAVICGPENFASDGQQAVLSLGDGNNYIKAVRGLGLKLGVYGGADTLAVTNGGSVDVKGNLRILSKSTSAIIAEMGEGLDYAEGFDVSDKDAATPGTVLVIDAKNPGRLAVSTRPYDRKVAGIVAGANDLKSGVRLGSGFDHDVALAGRVYCNVDATTAAIGPGDLLTTSARAGCAMKVTDHSRAQGAILGKAMQGLDKGRTGRILVLVTLQ